MKTNKEKYLISARAVAMAIASSLPRIVPKWDEAPSDSPFGGGKVDSLKCRV